MDVISIPPSGGEISIERVITERRFFSVVRNDGGCGWFFKREDPTGHLEASLQCMQRIGDFIDFFISQCRIDRNGQQFIIQFR